MSWVRVQSMCDLEKGIALSLSWFLSVVWAMPLGLGPVRAGSLEEPCGGKGNGMEQRRLGLGRGHHTALEALPVLLVLALVCTGCTRARGGCSGLWTQLPKPLCVASLPSLCFLLQKMGRRWLPPPGLEN